MDHLFLNGDLASFLWAFYGRLTSFVNTLDTFIIFLKAWMSQGSTQSQLGLFNLSLGGLIPWIIRNTRNEFRYAGIPFSFGKVLNRAHSLPSSIMSVTFFTRIPS